MQTKKWFQSKTLGVNLCLLAVFVLTEVGNESGLFHLTAEVVAGLGIAAGAVNLILRMVTYTAIEGSPAAQYVKRPVPHLLDTLVPEAVAVTPEVSVVPESAPHSS